MGGRRLITLYPHQTEFVDALRGAMVQYQSVLGQSPTGSGKTAVGAYIAGRVAERGQQIIFCVHRRNLAAQTAKTFAKVGLDYGFIAAGYPYDPTKPVQIASIDTLRNRLDSVPAPALLVIDEAHMAAAETWTRVVTHYRNLGSRILGLSATPRRLSGRSLSSLFDVLVPGKPVSWLIQEGYLSQYVAYAPSAPDLSDVHTRSGDYVRSELAEATDKPRITGSAIEHYRKLADGTLAICYCCSIKHSESVAEQFCAAGIPAAHIDGTTPEDERNRIVRAFADRQILVLCNVELITTGFDLSASVDRDVAVETIIGLRPTQSLTLQLQMVGRGMRAKPRPAIILDHAGNLLRHGLPDDDREWSLDDDRPKKAKPADEDDPDIAIRQCPECYFVHRPAADRRCPECGAPYPLKPRRVEEVDGTLRQFGRSSLVADPEQAMQTATSWQRIEAIAAASGLTLAEVIKLNPNRAARCAKGEAQLTLVQQAMGYKPSWVAWRLQSKAQARRKFQRRSA